MTAFESLKGKNSYKWVQGSHMKGDPNVAGAVCEQLDEQGMLTPENLVDVSRDENAPLHDAFEWDDSIAGEEWRKTQARKVIRSLIVIRPAVKGKTVAVDITPRAFVPTVQKVYMNITKVMEDPDKRLYLLNQAKKELKDFQNKYHMLNELAGVFAEIQKFVAE